MPNDELKSHVSKEVASGTQKVTDAIKNANDEVHAGLHKAGKLPVYYIIGAFVGIAVVMWVINSLTH